MTDQPTTIAGAADSPSWLGRVSTVPRPSDGSPLHLQRAWPRTNGHVLLEYRCEATGRIVVGQWLADPKRLRRVAESTAAAAGPRAAAVLADKQIVLHARGADRRLTALRPLLDDAGSTLVVHRPERRAVVRVDPRPGRGERRWVKVVRAERLPALLARTAQLAPLGAAVPRLLDVRTEQGVTIWTDLPGVPLADLLDAPGLVTTMRQLGVLLRRLHTIPIAPEPAYLHTWRHEQQVLSQWLAHLQCFDPVTHGQVAPLQQRASDLLAEAGDPADRLVTVHRDLHDGQIMVSDGGVGLLDPDTLAVGEPELDLGNLAAHLRFAARAGRCAAATADRAVEAVIDGYGREQVEARRLVAYTAASLLRLVGVHALRPPTRAWLGGLRDDADRLLHREASVPARR